MFTIIQREIDRARERDKEEEIYLKNREEYA